MRSDDQNADNGAYDGIGFSLEDASLGY